MSATTFTRAVRKQTVTVSTAASGSSSVLFNDAASGTVIVNDVTATATLTVYGSADGATFYPVYSFDGSPATISVGAAGGAAVMPDAVYPLRFLKLVSDSPLAEAASVVVAVKS